MTYARRMRRRQARAASPAASEDPGRDLLIDAVEQGYLTPLHAEALDEWAGALATTKLEGTLTEDELNARIIERLMADLARRGQA